MAASRAEGLAPLSVSTTVPFLRKRKVGMAVTRNRWANSGVLSTSNLQNVAVRYTFLK